MEKIFDSKLFPILTVLLSIVVGVIAALMGATAAMAILISILIELWITTHHSLAKIKDLEKMLGFTRGISSMSALIPKIHNVLCCENKWSNIILSFKLDKLSLEVDNLEKQRIPLSTEEFMEFAEKFFTLLDKNDRVFATSLFGGGDYWRRKYGIRYASLNKKAAQQGASITRTFIPRDQSDQQKLEQIFKEQAGYLQVRVVEHDDLNEVDRHAIKDFLLLNDELAIEFIFDASFKDIDSIVVILGPEDVKHYSKRMRKIIELSKEYILS